MKTEPKDYRIPEEWERKRARDRMHAQAIQEVQRDCYQIAEDHGFHDVGQTFGDKLMLIVSEAAEALEDFRDGKAPDLLWYDGEKPCGIPSELADIVIRVLDVAEYYGINLGDVILEKMAYNNTRPYLHGRTL